jgi:hypothetical protein
MKKILAITAYSGDIPPTIPPNASGVTVFALYDAMAEVLVYRQGGNETWWDNLGEEVEPPDFWFYPPATEGL